MQQPPLLDQETCQKLFEVESQYKKNTYPDPNGYCCALLTKQGNIYPGIAYRSDTETLTMHGEAIGLANAALHGETEIVAITGPNCHICKQLIYESSLRSKIDTLIILKDDKGYKQIPISELMPLPWPEEKV
jgi:cytidine deaminase